jgi:hypothetical protein
MKRMPVVITYEAAPSGSKIAEVAKLCGGDSHEALAILEEAYQGISAAYSDAAKRAENAWRVATAIEKTCDVALFVGDLATGGGKVSLTKTVTRGLFKELLNPAVLARNAAAQLKEKMFTTVVGHADMAIGLYNGGVVIATGDDSATFAVTGDAASSMSMLLGWKTLAGEKGLVANLAEMAKSPAGVKTVYGWGALSATLIQKGINGASVYFDDTGGDVSAAPVTFTETASDPDVARMAMLAADPALETVMAGSKAYSERYAEGLTAWKTAADFATPSAPPKAAAGTPPAAAPPATPDHGAADPGWSRPWTREAEKRWLTELAAKERPMSVDGSVKTTYGELYGAMEVMPNGATVSAADSNTLAMPERDFFAWLDANYPGWR